jgi:diguanylate cyclase (GGDEF)-like protein/PAS domain S-box-containing protein
LVPRAALRRRLDQLAPDTAAGVIHFDLRRFREINERWGHGFGDNVLAITQRRLLRAAPRRALISDAGPTFTMVLPDTDSASTRATAEQLAATIRTPIKIGTVQVILGVNTGFACAGSGNADVTLLEHAMLAFRTAKDLGSDEPAEYVDALGRDATSEQRMEAELHAAITAGDLRAYFQPVVDLRDGSVVGLEALVRWPHADGLLLPEVFLGVAENAGLMPDVGQWMFDRVLLVLARLRGDDRAEPLRVWINLSANELTGADDVLRRITAAIDDGIIGPREIGFEVTESTLLSDLESAVDTLSSLRRLGVEIALDDFGTGYSSLSYLRRLPVTAVKIDRSFVAGLGRSLADEAIVEAVIDLAHALGLRVIAEGVEDAVQADALIGLGADEAQGFLFGTPAPIEQLDDVINRLWGGATPPEAAGHRSIDHRADALPGFGSPRARLLLAALDTAHDAIIVTAGAGDGVGTREIIYVNAAFEADTGFAARALVGQPIDELFSQPGDPELAAWYDGVYAAAHGASREVVWRRADGSTYVCEMTVSPIFDERGVLTHWLHTGRDVTRRHVLEAERARFQWMIEQSESLVFLFEPGGRWVYANAAMRAAIGLAPDAPLDGVSNTGVGLSTGEIDSLLDEDVQRLRTTGTWSGPCNFVDPGTGTVTEALCDIQRLTDPLAPSERLYVVVCRDVTEVNALERAEHRRRELVAVVTQLAHRGVEGGVEDVLAGLDAIIARFGEQLDCEVVSVDVLDEPRDGGDAMFRTANLWQRDADAAMQPAVVTPASQLRGWLQLVDTERVLINPQPAEHDGWDGELVALFPGRPRGSSLFARLKVGGELLGVFGLGCRDAGREWTVDEIEAVEGFANVLGNLLHRHRSVVTVHDEMAAAARRAAFERVQIGVAEWALALDAEQFLGGLETHLEQLCTVLRADVVSLATLDGGELRRSARWPEATSSPIGGTPRLNRSGLLAKLPDLEPLIVGDIAMCTEPWATEWRREPDAPRSAMLVPLGTAGRWYGVIVVAMEHTTRAWDDAEIALVRGITGMVASVVARRHIEASLRSGETRLQAMLDGSPDLILVVDDVGITRFANLTVRKLLDASNEDLVGTPVIELVHPDDRSLAEERLSTLLAGLPTIATRVRAIRPDGSESWWEITSGVQRNSLVGGTILTCRDVTSHVIVERGAATRVERLRYAFDLAQLALDLGPDAFLDQLDESCTQIARMLGADRVWVDQVDETREVVTTIGHTASDETPATLPFASLPNWLRRVRDPEPVRIASIAEADEPWAVERRRISGLAGAVVAVAMSAAGELVGELGVAMDEAQREWDDDEVTFLRIVGETIAHVLERARLDAALRASEARFRILSETAADVVILIDDRGIIAYVSPSSHALLGYTPAQLIGQPAATLLPAGRGDLIRLVDDREDRDASGPAEVELRRSDGELIWVAHSTSAVLDSRSNSRVTYRISVRDITERKRLETELSWQALHDPLTGLGNRVLLQRRLDDAVRTASSGKGLAVLLIDLDKFKEVNDTLGHAHGDEVLRIVSARLSSLTRPSDTLARTGGDEFVVICPDTEPLDAVNVGERIVRTLAEPVVTGGASVCVGASVGVAHAGDGFAGADSDRLLNDADRAMYVAKEAGGNTVRLA